MTKPFVLKASDIVAAVHGTMPTAETLLGGYWWRQSIPRASAAAWAFAAAADSAGNQVMADVTEIAKAMESTAGLSGRDLTAGAKLTVALSIPTIVASLTHIGRAPEPTDDQPSLEPPAIAWTSVSELFPLQDNANPTVPHIAPLGDPALCSVMVDFVNQLPDPITQVLLTIAQDLQGKYSAITKEAAGPFKKAPPANS